MMRVGVGMGSYTVVRVELNDETWWEVINNNGDIVAKLTNHGAAHTLVAHLSGAKQLMLQYRVKEK